MNYFVWNKPLDYRRGYMEGLEYTKQGVCLKKGVKSGYFFSRVADSQEKETIWHRMTCILPYTTAKIKLSFYAADNNTMWVENKGQREETEIETLLLSDRSLEQKKALFRPFLQKECFDVNDILLHDVTGRYFFFLAEIYGQLAGEGGIENLFCYFPKETWISYLPAIYQKDKASLRFLEQYLGVFKSIYDDFERAFKDSISALDSAGASQEGLLWLAGWLHLNDLYLWNETQLRTLVERSAVYYQKRGTPGALLELITLFTGEKPFMVEEWQTRRYRQKGEKKERLKALYGEDENVFLLLLKEEYLAGNKEREVLKRLVAAVAPAFMEVKLVPLRPMLFLGEYVYLGVNSVLGAYEPMRLDGHSLLSFSTI